MITNGPSTYQRSVGGYRVLRHRSIRILENLTFRNNRRPWSIDHWLTNGPFLESLFGHCFCSLFPRGGVLFQCPLSVRGDTLPKHETPNYIFQVLGKSHTKFKQNEHLKLTKTHHDTQAHSKAHFANLMDMMRYLTSKLYTLPMKTNVTHSLLKICPRNTQQALVNHSLLQSVIFFPT